MDNITVELSKPITDVSGKEHKELVLIEPTGRQWDVVGNPAKMMLDGEKKYVEIDNQKLTKYISLVTEVDETTLYKLSLVELQKIQNEMMTFFGQADTSS